MNDWSELISLASTGTWTSRGGSTSGSLWCRRAGAEVWSRSRSRGGRRSCWSWPGRFFRHWPTSIRWEWSRYSLTPAALHLAVQVNLCRGSVLLDPEGQVRLSGYGLARMTNYGAWVAFPSCVEPRTTAPEVLLLLLPLAPRGVLWLTLNQISEFFSEPGNIQKI